VADPLGSGKSYWWNQESNQTTHVGAAKPGSASSVFEKLTAFKNQVAHDMHSRQRRRFIMGDGGGYYGGGGGGGDAGGGGGGG
ncbi:unnamed protein product, partial [Polarella glacialis]